MGVPPLPPRWMRKNLIGHKPKVLRTPAPKHPSRTIRATWVFRDGEWSKTEDKVNIEELDVRAAKLEANTVMSITIFERSPESEEEVPDSDREADPQTPEERLRAEAKITNISIVHVTLRAQCRLYVSHVMFRLKPHPRQTVAAVVKVCRLWLGRSGVEKCRVDHKIGSKTFMVAELLAKASS